MNLNSKSFIQVRFDYLGTTAPNLGYRLIHCDYQWVSSDLLATEFLDGFEEHNIFDYRYSINTKVTFVHYNFSLQKSDVLNIISGNYKF